MLRETQHRCRTAYLGGNVVRQYICKNKNCDTCFIISRYAYENFEIINETLIVHDWLGWSGDKNWVITKLTEVELIFNSVSLAGSHFEKFKRSYRVLVDTIYGKYDIVYP